MSLRRYAPMKPSLGTRWDPAIVREAVLLHRGRCLGAVVGMPGPCAGELEPDHIRASGGMGMKSRSTLDNCAPMCGEHHRLKTREGRKWRMKLIEAVERAMAGLPDEPDCGHVDPVFGCASCQRRTDPLTLPETA